MSAATQFAPAPDPYYDELRRVIASPDDDAPRLRYAERCGGPRAEFIQAQLRLASLPGGIDHPEAPWLTAHSDALLTEGGEGWAPAWYASRGIRVRGFDRGFAECIAGSGAALADPSLQKYLVESAPIRHLDITRPYAPEDIGEVLNSTLGQQVMTLSLDDGNLGAAELEALVHSKAARNIRWLSLVRSGLSFDDIRFLATHSRQLPELEHVFLAGNEIDPVEQHAEDQSVVVQSWMPPEGEQLEREFGRIRWLHPPVANSRRLPVDRMALGRRAAHGIAG